MKRRYGEGLLQIPQDHRLLRYCRWHKHFFSAFLTSFVASLFSYVVFVWLVVFLFLRPKLKSHIIAIWWKKFRTADLYLPRLHGSKPCHPCFHATIHPFVHLSIFFHLFIKHSFSVSYVSGTLVDGWSSSWSKWTQVTYYFPPPCPRLILPLHSTEAAQTPLPFVGSRGRQKPKFEKNISRFLFQALRSINYYLLNI